MKIVCISDTHSLHSELEMPEGDVLVHAGDMTKTGHEAELRLVNEWFGTLNYDQILVIPGSCDFYMEERPRKAEAILSNATVITDKLFQWKGVKFWGFPWVPYLKGYAFELEPEAFQDKLKQIPKDVNVLVTHIPPESILDQDSIGKYHGCAGLLEVLSKIKPDLHVFGMEHNSYGSGSIEGVKLVNASSCTPSYRCTNPPIVVEI